MVEGSTAPVYDLDGPWCDVWSLGVIILRFCLGSLSVDDITEVLYKIHRSPLFPLPFCLLLHGTYNFVSPIPYTSISRALIPFLYSMCSHSTYVLPLVNLWMCVARDGVAKGWVWSWVEGVVN